MREDRLQQREAAKTKGKGKECMFIESPLDKTKSPHPLRPSYLTDSAKGDV